MQQSTATFTGRYFYMQKYNCIKCGTEYQSKDNEAYLCDACNEIRLAIAKEIDAKFVPSKIIGKSNLQVFEELARTKGVRGFVNAKDLML